MLFRWRGSAWDGGSNGGQGEIFIGYIETNKVAAVFSLYGALV